MVVLGFVHFQLPLEGVDAAASGRRPDLRQLLRADLGRGLSTTKLLHTVLRQDRGAAQLDNRGLDVGQSVELVEETRHVGRREHA